MKDELVIHTKPKSNISEDIRTIRTNLQFTSSDEESKVIGVYTLAKKVKYRTQLEEKVYKREELYEKVLFDGEGNFRRTMAIVSFNNAGEVCEIVTAIVSSASLTFASSAQV